MDPMEEEEQEVVVPPPAAAGGAAPVRYGEVRRADNSAAIAAGVAAGNIFRQSDAAEVMALPEASAAVTAEQQAVVDALELKRRMKALVVPVADGDVRRLLRDLGEPVTLFGEREMERRDRLRKLLALMTEEQQQAVAAKQLQALGPLAAAGAAPAPRELFFTEGPPELLDARLEVARFSLARAAGRIAAQKRRREDPDEDADAAEAEAARHVRALAYSSSELADDRPVAACAFSPDGAALATGSWGGGVKVWAMPAVAPRAAFRASADRVTGVAWHPGAGAPGAPPGAPALATAAADGAARLWDAGGRQLRALEGHTDRLGRLAFHPGGRLLATASFDHTWRLWDVESGACLAEQEGHSRAVYAVAFQGDGALAASGGMDAAVRLWDVRTGRTALVLEGHAKAVLALDFSPSGYHLASGGEDNTARVWDLRRRAPLAVLPGHESLVSQVRFEPCDGHYLLTAGFDGAVKLWCGRRLRLTKTLAGHAGKVMAADVCPDGSYLLATTGYDRTLKTWQPAADALAADDGAA